MRIGTVGERVAVAVIVASAAWVPSAGAQAQVQEPAPQVQQKPAPQVQQKPAPKIPRGSLDGRRTLKRLPDNFLRGLTGVVSQRSVPPLMVGVAASALFLGADESIANPDGADNAFGKLGAGLGDPVYVGGLAVAMLASGRLASGYRWRDATYDVFVAAGVNFVYTEALKRTVARTRPNGQNDRSFPSGHSSNAFAWATVLERHYGLGVGIPMYTVASLVGISRVSKGKHYLTDVFAGATIGFIVGRSVVRQGNVVLDEPPVALFPIVGPRGQPGIAARFTF